MAHYSFIDQNNIVVQVFTGRDETDTENLPDGYDSWESYYESQKEDLICKRTSYNTSGNQHQNGGVAFRGNYAVIGGTYDPDNDVFLNPKPYEDWILNENTWMWDPPIPYPENAESNYFWDVDSGNWVQTE